MNDCIVVTPRALISVAADEAIQDLNWDDRQIARRLSPHVWRTPLDTGTTQV